MAEFTYKFANADESWYPCGSGSLPTDDDVVFLQLCVALAQGKSLALLDSKIASWSQRRDRRSSPYVARQQRGETLVS